MEATTFIVNPKVKVALIRAAKGYRWTVEVTHEDPDEALAILDKVESELKQRYGITTQ